MEILQSIENEHTTMIYPEDCAFCESGDVSTSMFEYEYVNGVGEAAIHLTLEVPVQSCSRCELQFKDYVYEEIEHGALWAHHGLLNRRQVRNIRKRYKLSQSDFAALTGLGEASLSRWENGDNCQSVAHDRYLRLLRDPTIFRALHRTIAQINDSRRLTPEALNVFQSLQSGDREKLVARSCAFRLRDSIAHSIPSVQTRAVGNV